MFCDTLVIYDHLFQTIKVVSHLFAPSGQIANLPFIYQTAVSKARRAAKMLLSPNTPSVHQGPIMTLGETAVSNMGKEGYEGFVTKLKEHIVAGDIIQAVPSQRLCRPTSLNPFNAYRQLRQVNPSPYMFYLDCGDFQIVGSSPETLCKVTENKVHNHTIAGTTKRGKNPKGKFCFRLLQGIGLIMSFRGRRTWESPAGIRKGSSGTHHVGRFGTERCQQSVRSGDR